MSSGVAHKNIFCRCCLVADVDLYYMKNLQFTYNGVQVRLIDTFWECSGLVQKTTFGVFDAEPKICLNCKLQLESVHNFRALCHKTDDALQTMYAFDSEPTSDEAFTTKPFLTSQLSDDIKTEINQDELIVSGDSSFQTDYSSTEIKLELTEQPESIFQTEAPCTSSSFFQLVQPNMHHVPSATVTTSNEVQQFQNTSSAPQKQMKIICNKCGEVSNNQTESIFHDRTQCICRPLEFFDVQLQRKKFQCKKCAKSYASNVSFQQHIKTDHKNVRFECTDCAKVFRSRHGLRSHMVTHTKIYPYVCPVEECSYKGAQSYAFKIHLQNHHNIQ
jgi:hypothetical protein